MPLSWCSACALPGRHCEVRQLAKCHVHPERAGPTLVVRHPCKKVRRQRVRVHQPREQQFRIQVGHNKGRGKRAAVRKLHARHSPVAHQHFLHRAIEPDRHPRFLAGLRHSLRDRAHAPDGMAPITAPAVHATKIMVQQHIRRTRRVRAGVIANDGIEPERRLYRIRLEPEIQQLPRRLGEQIKQIALPLHIQPAQQIPLLQRASQPPNPVRQVRRRLRGQHPQHIGHPLQHRVIIRQPRRIARGELRHLVLRALQPAAKLQIPTILGRQEVGDRALDNPQPARVQPHVGNHPLMQQAHRVAGHRVAKPGMECFGHGGSAHHATPFRNRHAQPRARQVIPADEPVMPAAHYNNVPHASDVARGARCAKHRRARPRRGASAKRDRAPELLFQKEAKHPYPRSGYHPKYAAERRLVGAAGFEPTTPSPPD